MLDRSLLAEIEGTFASGSAGKQADTLRRITDLFLAGASNYSGEQVDLFDGVISRLAERIETKARIELANRLAPVSNAPATTVRQLARDPSIEVASPILSQSPQLTDKDLLAIAADNSQERLLAISKRAVLSANIGDVLAARGYRDVVLSVTQNEGARFSDIGYDTLVDRSIDDEVLAICVGMRKDIPRDHFHALISKASEAVFDKLAASNPAAVAEVQKVLTGITGQEVAARPKAARDYREAEEAFDKTRRAGKSADAALQEFASAGKFFETVAALSALSQAPREFVESVMSDRRGANDSALLLAKAAGLSWSSAKAICILRRGPGGIPPLAIEAARQAFERLRTETAQRVVRFYNERHNALGAFERLAQHVEEDGGPPMPRAATRAASRG
jgi:uncharacterized protein (DUF2336 family)